MTPREGAQDAEDDAANAEREADDRPLPERNWSRREVETVEAEEFLVDVTVLSLAQKRDEGAEPDRAAAGPGLNPLSCREPRDIPEKVSAPRVAPAAAIEARVLHAQAPESVRPGQRFAVSAQLLCSVYDDGSTAVLRPLEVPPRGRTVSIDLHVSGGLAVLADSTASVTLLAGQSSDPVRFELEARTPGQAGITLRAFADGLVFLGQLRLTIPVNDAVPGAHQSVTGPSFQATPPPERGATLEVDVDPSRMTLRFRLRGPGDIGIQRPEEVALSAAVDSVAKELEGVLDQIAKGNFGTAARPVEAMLRNYGADLWTRLLPNSVKDTLLRNLTTLEELVVIGSDDPLPWELLLPVVPGERQDFLGDQLLIRRWAFGAASPRILIGAGEVRYVLPDSAPPAAFNEVDGLRAILGTGERVSTLDGLLDELDLGRFGILHFAAHNVGAGALPASAYVKLDKPFLQAMLGTDRPGLFYGPAPLVFMNACNSGAASPQWAGSTGWAGRFLAAGAGAFVGSLWQVRDGPAKEFAESFYTAFQSGQTLGTAFSAARRAVFTPGDPTRLGYMLVGHSAATLARRKGSHE